MSTFFVGEGNIGSAPEFQEFNNPPDEPRRLLRLNVYFDNPVPREGGYEDRPCAHGRTMHPDGGRVQY